LEEAVEPFIAVQLCSFNVSFIDSKKTFTEIIITTGMSVKTFPLLSGLSYQLVNCFSINYFAENGQRDCVIATKTADKCLINRLLLKIIIFQLILKLQTW